MLRCIVVLAALALVACNDPGEFVEPQFAPGECKGGGKWACEPDTERPSIPQNLTATATSSSTIDLAWSASTDNVGVTGYVVRRNGAVIATTPATSYSDTGLAAETLYTYRVAAGDSAGNVSEVSAPASATTFAEPPPGEGFTVPAAIDATGTTDVTGELSAFIAGVPDNSTIIFPAGSTYRVEGMLALYDRHGLTFEGAGSTLIQDTDGSGTSAPPGSLSGWVNNWPRARSFWAGLNCSGITWRGFNHRGANPNAGLADAAYVVALEAQHGFAVLACDDVEIDDVTVTDIYGDFVYLANFTTVQTSNVHVHDSHFERNGRQGWAVVGAVDVLIENNYLGEVRRTNIDLEPNSTNGGASRIEIRNNHIGPTRLNFLSSLGSCGPIHDVSIHHNTLAGQALKVAVRAPEGCRRTNINLSNNTADKIYGGTHLMTFTRVDQLTVSANVNPLQAGRDMQAIGLTDVCGFTIAGNVFANALAEYVVLVPCGG